MSAGDLGPRSPGWAAGSTGWHLHAGSGTVVSGGEGSPREHDPEALMIVALSLVALMGQVPPPLCRGRDVGGYQPAHDAPAMPRAVAEVMAAYEALCPAKTCGRGVVLRNDTIGMNAVTWVSGVRDGPATQAKIVYSPRFLAMLAERFGDGASFGVLAHEVGHVLTAAKSLRSSFDHAWDEELRADYLAGCALGRAGRPPSEMEHALQALAASASPTHPAFDRRNPVVRKGYLDCKAQQDSLDEVQKHAPRFGLGAVVEGEGKGCWTYYYRAAEDVERLGPVAATRRRSPRYGTEGACAAARAGKVDARERVAEPCKCL